MLKYTWKFSKMYIVYILLLQIVTAVVPLASVVLPGYIVEELTNGRRLNVLIMYISALAIIHFLGNSLISFLQGKSFVSKGIVFMRFQTFITEKLSLCDYEQLENPEFLDVKEKANRFLYADGQGFGVVLDSAVNIIGKIFVFVGLSAILSTMNIFIVLLFIALVLLDSLFESKVRKNYSKWDLEKAPIERKTGYLIGLVEDFECGKEIRINNYRDKLVSKVREHLMLSNEFYKKQTREYKKSDYFSNFTSFIREGVSYLYLVWNVISGGCSVGQFTMYLSAISQFSDAMNAVMQNVLNIKQFGMYYNELEKYMNVPAKMREGKKLPLPEGKNRIEFKNVFFRYPGQSEYTLKNINIAIENGEKISIVGENGAGKTTFIKLLVRLYDPTSGSILLNGVDIRDIDYDQYQTALSAVFQDYSLFSFTLRDNIVLGNDSRGDDARIVDCLKLSGFEGKLNRLEHGLDTHVYKNFETDGFEPSGGEAQKIVLARALFKNAPIVILDEPNAALDPRAEYEMYQKFDKLVDGKTAIYISHRLSSAKFCDRIVVFRSGEIVENGTHSELMEKNGIYADLFHMQSQYYVDEK